MASGENSSLMSKLKSNVGLWFLLGMGVLLLLRVILMLTESTAGAQTDAQPSTVTMTATLTPDSISYLMLDKVLTPWGDFKNSKYYLLAQYNMFDPKLVQDAPQLSRNADASVQQAQAAMAAGNLAQARELAQKALGMQPNHLVAQQLLRTIDEKMAAATAPTTGTTARGAAPPAATPAPPGGR